MPAPTWETSSTKAIRQPDGTFKLQGTKIFITGGDQDLTENIIHPVLARIEGDPAGTKGISIFIVPKFLVNDDGTLGRRNDYEIGKIEEKMGIHGSATCLINFGDNNDCYGELLGEERQGMKVMFQMMNEAQDRRGPAGPLQRLHRLPPRAAVYQAAAPGLVAHGDSRTPRPRASPSSSTRMCRRMLLWMKSNVDGMQGAHLLHATTAATRHRVAQRTR
ncbi:MAG: acyl-CoA dehydrogenase family protein [Rhodopseudomonas palustris]|nr:acyl-CoA dehydrogenase family protein [Rhodopseudomonas palustris]